MTFLVFFSSRRRHTRSYGDWSSDVCSSDLSGGEGRACTRGGRDRPEGSRADRPSGAGDVDRIAVGVGATRADELARPRGDGCRTRTDADGGKGGGADRLDLTDARVAGGVRRQRRVARLRVLVVDARARLTGRNRHAERIA